MVGSELFADNLSILVLDNQTNRNFMDSRMRMIA